jgi:hypothetical protein
MNMWVSFAFSFYPLPFWDRVWLCNPGWLHICGSLASASQVHHHAWLCLFLNLHRRGIVQHIPFYTWLLLLSTLSVWFVHVAAYVCRSSLLLSGVRHCFIHSSVKRYLVCFWLRIIRNKTAVNILAQVFLWTGLISLRNGITGSVERNALNFIRNYQGGFQSHDLPATEKSSCCFLSS